MGIKKKLISMRCLVGLLAGGVLLVSLVVGASPAFAGTPVWWTTSYTVPSELPPGGNGQIVIDVSNLGNADMNGTFTLVDRLPAGVKITSIVRGLAPCVATMAEGAEVLTCEGGSGLKSYEEREMEINVSVAQGASVSTNVVNVSGAGAASASNSEQVEFGSAPASFGVDKLEQLALNEDGTPDTQAGSHPFQYVTTLQLNEQLTVSKGVVKDVPVRAPALPKDLHFDLPPGLIGNPTIVPQCTMKQFESFIPTSLTVNLCPVNTVIGIADVKLEEHGVPFLGAPLFNPDPVFNLEPRAGEPARFGFEVAGIPVILDTSIRSGADYGVVVSVNDINTQIELGGSQVAFWGTPSSSSHDQERGYACILDGFWNEYYEGALGSCPVSLKGGAPAPPFLTLPTSCTGPLQSSVEADSWVKQGEFQTGGYTWHDSSGPLGLDGCNRLPFEPSMSVTPDARAGSSPTGITVDEHVPQEATLDPGGLAESDVKGLSVTLPEGVALNPSAADGLQACSVGQIGLGSGEAPGCPESSKVATVKVKTPLLPNPLEGAAYLAAQDANPFGSLVALYIYAEDPTSGVRIKAAGEVLENPVTGQLTAHFERDPFFEGQSSQFLPQLPFEDVVLHFFGGERAPLGTPSKCGAYTTTGTFTPWSDGPDSQSSSTFDVTSGPNGGPCNDPLPFAPSLTAGVTSNQAGGFSPFTMTMSREDGNQNLKAIELHMPPGLLATLTGVPLCGEVQADAGTCPAASLIGETTVGVGLGGHPYAVKGGRVYLTGPYKGAPFGLSIVNPAKAGPFDLGQVIVRAKLELNRTTAAVTVTSDATGPYAIPPIIDGIPLEIQHVNVTINRPGGFTFNPTDCNPMKITGTLDSTEETTQSLSVPFQVTNCATLKFEQKFSVSTAAKTSRTNGASLTVKLTRPSGPTTEQTNFAQVKVDLPRQLPSRLTTLQKACTAATFEANPAGCPAASIVGHVKVVTPLLPVPLEGPAYFVSHGGEAFPTLIFVLQGYGVRLDVVSTTFISKGGVTSATLKTVPDAPFTSFELTLPEGPFSALGANANLCKVKGGLRMPTSFVAQNGMAIHQTTKIAVKGCSKRKAGKAGAHADKRAKGRRKKKG